MLIICILALISIRTHGKSPLNFSGGKYTDKIMGLPYLTISAGAGIWYLSGQEGMENRHIPYSLSLEYGRTSFPVSLFAGTFFHTTFNIDHFLLNPNNFLLGLQYTPLRGTPVSKKFNIYAIGGINLSYSTFTEELYPGIINYENKIEKKTGAGIGAGIGMGYRYKSWEIKPVLYYFTGHSDFFAGHFTEQSFNTGSMQLHLSLAYKIIFNKNNRTCPVYKKYYRL